MRERRWDYCRGRLQRPATRADTHAAHEVTHTSFCACSDRISSAADGGARALVVGAEYTPETPGVLGACRVGVDEPNDLVPLNELRMVGSKLLVPFLRYLLRALPYHDKEQGKVPVPVVSMDALVQLGYRYAIHVVALRAGGSVQAMGKEGAGAVVQTWTSRHGEGRTGNAFPLC